MVAATAAAFATATVASPAGSTLGGRGPPHDALSTRVPLMKDANGAGSGLPPPPHASRGHGSVVGAGGWQWRERQDGATKTGILALLSAVLSITGYMVGAFTLQRPAKEAAEIGAQEAVKHAPAVAKAEKDAHTATRVKFHARRLDAVKAHIVAASGAGEHLDDAPDALEFDRTDVRKLLDVMGRTEGLYFMGAPKGEGKSTLMSHIVASCPYAMYVDVDQASPDAAIRAIADAIGYDMSLDADETSAAAAGVALPDLAALQGQAQFIKLMKVYEQACVELQAAGKLQVGRCPVLLLDHATRPLKNAGGTALEGDNLLYDAVLVGHRFANKHIASLAFISSDPLMQKQAWESASGRDSVRYVRVPPFTVPEAKQLLARRIFRAQTADQRAALLQRAAARATHRELTTADVLATVTDQYGGTVDFALAAVGTRPRWLELLTGNKECIVLADVELQREGVLVPAPYEKYVEPATAAAGRVDPGVLAAFERLVDERVSALGDVLDVPGDIALRDITRVDELLLRRIIVTDAALRQMLDAAPAALKYSHIRGAFNGRETDLLRLGEKHIVFYDRQHLALEFESELMRRVVAARLASAKHAKTLALARALLDLPKQVKAAADAKENAWAWMGTIKAHQALAEKVAAIAILRRDIVRLSSHPQLEQH